MISHDQLVAFCDSYKKHPDQGVKACKKVLQKNPGSLLHQIALAHFTSHLGRHEDALQQCEQISLKSPEWSEPDIVIEYQHLFVRCSKAVGRPASSAGKLLIPLWKDQFEKFARINGREVRTAMFSAAFENDQWDLLQQFFAWLQRDFPKQSKYHFSWIAATQILADSLAKTDEKMAQFSGLLAYKSCKVLITNTLEDKDTPRKINSTQELRLIVNTLRRQGHTDELLELLENDKVGIKSDIGKNDIEFIRLKLELLVEQQKWDEVFSSCYRSLETFITIKQKSDATDQELSAASWADDWTVWRQLVNAGLELPEHSEVSNLIETYLQADPRSRTAGRAKLLLMSKSQRETLLDQCQSFLDQQLDRKACFDDMKEFTVQLSTEEQATLLKTVEPAIKPESPLTRTTLAKAINALKLAYITRSNTTAEVSTSPPANSLQTAKSCISLYEQSLKDGLEEGDDSCILAAMILCQFGLPSATEKEVELATRDQQGYLLQSLQILQHLERNSPHSSDGRLCALRVQQQLGLYSGLTKTFISGLNPKQVQWDSLGHLLYTRISTSHPLAVADKTLVRRLPSQGADPLTSLEQAMKWNGGAIDSVTNLLAKDPEKLAYDKLAEFARFKSCIDQSFSLAVLKLEKRRIMRIQGKAFGADESPARLCDAANDNRDFASFVNYEAGSSRSFERITETGPRPTMYWLAQWTLNDLTQSLIGAKSPEAWLRRIEEAATYVNTHATRTEKELSTAEKHISDGWTLLNTLSCSLILGSSCTLSSKNIKADFQALAKWTKDLLPRRSQPDDGGEGILTWTYLHERWLALEFIRALDRFCDLALAVAKQKTHSLAIQIPTASVNEMRAQSRNVAKEIQGGAQAFAKTLKNEGLVRYEELIKGGELGGMVVNVVGMNEVKASVATIVADAVDGLDGLAKVKVF